VFKRLFWLSVGAGLGFGLSFRLTRFFRVTVQRYRPERVSAAVTGLGQDVRSALAEGRVAMRDREVELKANLGHPRPS
jgi:hypothetical protein